MILKSKLVLFGLALMVIGCAAVSLQAQGADKEKTEQEAARQKELEKNALKLLDQVIGDAGSLKLRENRSYVLMAAADVLWTYDEKRARSLFWEALGALNLQTYQEVNQSSPKETNNSTQPVRPNGPTKEQLEEVNKYYVRINARSEFLHKVASHDPQLALDMMRSTRQGPPPNTPGIARFDPDVSLEQELTFAAAANDPKRALQLAHENLAKGLTYQVLNLLREINQQDQDAGSQLAGDIIAKLKTENLNTVNSYAPFMAVSLIQSSRTGGAVLVASHDVQTSRPITRLKLDDYQKQDLVVLLTDAALNATGSGNVLQTIRFVMPEIEQYAPNRVARLKARLAEFDRTLPPNMRDWNNFDARFEKATPEEMIGAASKVSEDRRGELFYRAASKAVASGEADRYRELLNNLDDEAQRKNALDALNQEQMFDDIAHERTDDLEKLFPLIRVHEQRVMAMAQLALMLEKKDQHDAAVKLLDKARALVKVSLTDDAQSNALLAVMLAFALVDPPKAFAMIEPIIDRTNDEVAKLLLVDKVVRTGATKSGEIILNQTQFPLDSRMMQYSAGVVALGKADFDRTKALAERFQRNELKVAARLLIAQAMLRASAQRPRSDQR